MGKMTKPFERLEHQWSWLFSVTSSAKNPWEKVYQACQVMGNCQLQRRPVKGEGLLRMMQSRISSESGDMNSIPICSCLDATHRISILADFHSTCPVHFQNFLFTLSFWYHHWQVSPTSPWSLSGEWTGSGKNVARVQLLLLMEEIPNNHLGCTKPCK